MASHVKTLNFTTEITRQLHKINYKLKGLKQWESIVGHVHNTSPSRPPGHIIIRCLNHLSWLLLL